MRANRSRTTAAVFRHPVLGDFEIPGGADDAKLEEHIIQHLAAAAAMRMSHRHHRRDGHHRRSGANSHPQILVLPTDEFTLDGSMRATSSQKGDSVEPTSIVTARRLATLVERERTTRGLESAISPSLHCYAPDSTDGSNIRISENQLTPGPSDVQSFSADTLRSRLQSASMKYKDSIAKSTSWWRERWFSRSNTISDLGSGVRRDVNAGVAAVSRVMERLETKDGTGPSATSASGSGSSH